MLKISKELVLKTLKAKDIDILKLASNPIIFEKACRISYKAIPWPLRWFVGKKRVRQLAEMTKEVVSRNPQTFN